MKNDDVIDLSAYRKNQVSKDLRHSLTPLDIEQRQMEIVVKGMQEDLKRFSRWEARIVKNIYILMMIVSGVAVRVCSDSWVEVADWLVAGGIAWWIAKFLSNLIWNKKA